MKDGGELRVLSIPQESVSKVEGEKLAARKSITYSPKSGFVNHPVQ